MQKNLTHDLVPFLHIKEIRPLKIFLENQIYKKDMLSILKPKIIFINLEEFENILHNY